MQNSHRFVPMIDVRPDAIVFGSRVVVDDREMLHLRDVGQLDDLIAHRLIHGIESALLQAIKGDPKQAASIMKMESVNEPSDRPWVTRGGQRDTTYSLKLAIMHPDKLRELEQAGRGRDTQVMAAAKLAQTVTDLRKELAVAKEKADRFDAIQNALRTKLDEADKADF